MKPKSLVLLLVAGGCGLVASFAVTQYLPGKQTDTGPAGEPLKQVFVAAADLDAGTQLKPDMLKVVTMRAKDLPDGVFTKEKQDDLIGETLRFPVIKGDMVLSGKLGGDKSLATLLKELPDGMRLGLVRVSDDDAPMAGLINPGDRVDVWWRPGRPDVPVKTLMQNIQVLAVGHRIRPVDQDLATSKESKSNDQHYTLMVTPEQNRRLVAASSAGRIRLVPRGKGDKSVDAVDENALDILLQLKGAAQSSPAPEKYEIEILKGPQSTVEEYDKPQHQGIHGNR